MKIDNSWDRYFGKVNDSGYKRYAYSVSYLFGSVLDIGCGDGFGIYLMNKQNVIKKITGIDVMIIKADAENIPFDSNSFDCVHCGQTLEHVKDDEKVIKEIKRVVRKRVIFSVPINGGISNQHIREYTELSIIKLLSSYFKIVSTKIFIDEKKHKRLVLITEK